MSYNTFVSNQGDNLYETHNSEKRPLIAHVIYRLSIGGLENGLVNLLNGLSESKYRHVVICVTYSTEFRNRINRQDVEVIELHKKPGNDISTSIRLWKILKNIRPDILHTRNIGTIEYSIPGWLAGIRCHIHGEHGRDMLDIDGTNKKYIFLRKFYGLFISKYLTVSKDLEIWLYTSVGINRKKIVQIYNGVDKVKFSPFSKTKKLELRAKLGLKSHNLIVGTVGRLQEEKNQLLLIQSFNEIVKNTSSTENNNVTLLIIGDGPDYENLKLEIKKLHLEKHIILLGARNDIPELLNCMDVFILPSLGEGISNTILEAMACGLPVIGTKVGGNPELIIQGENGCLVSPFKKDEMVNAIKQYINNPNEIALQSRKSRIRIEKYFSIDVMLKNYQKLYDVAITKTKMEI